MKVLPRSSVQENTNIISIHITYRLKQLDDNDLEMKARSAPHGNKDQDRETPKLYLTSDPPVSIPVVASVSTLFKWLLTKIDFSVPSLRLARGFSTFMPYHQLSSMKNGSCGFFVPLHVV